jgi:hypothetical protein
MQPAMGSLARTRIFRPALTALRVERLAIRPMISFGGVVSRGWRGVFKVAAAVPNPVTAPTAAPAPVPVPVVVGVGVVVLGVDVDVVAVNGDSNAPASQVLPRESLRVDR